MIDAIKNLANAIKRFVFRLRDELALRRWARLGPAALPPTPTTTIEAFDTARAALRLGGRVVIEPVAAGCWKVLVEDTPAGYVRSDDASALYLIGATLSPATERAAEAMQRNVNHLLVKAGWTLAESRHRWGHKIEVSALESVARQRARTMRLAPNVINAMRARQWQGQTWQSVVSRDAERPPANDSGSPPEAS